MKPIVNGLEEEYGDRIAFLQLDADNDGRNAFAAFGLRGHPSYVIIDTIGDVLWKDVGEQPASELADAIQPALEGNQGDIGLGRGNLELCQAQMEAILTYIKTLCGLEQREL